MAIMHYGGLLTGRMGDKVFYIKNGKQMVRSAHAAVSNPRTPAQMRQRRLMKQVQERVSALLADDREAMNRAYREAGGVANGKVYSNVYTWLIAREMAALREEYHQTINGLPMGDRQEPNGR